MVKKGALVFLLFAFMVALAGCETVKGATMGAADGFQKDWQAAQKVDDWMRKNLW